jgi:hypothetical protein
LPPLGGVAVVKLATRFNDKTQSHGFGRHDRPAGASALATKTGTSLKIPYLKEHFAHPGGLYCGRFRTLSGTPFEICADGP